MKQYEFTFSKEELEALRTTYADGRGNMIDDWDIELIAKLGNYIWRIEQAEENKRLNEMVEAKE